MKSLKQLLMESIPTEKNLEKLVDVLEEELDKKTDIKNNFGVNAMPVGGDVWLVYSKINPVDNSLMLDFSSFVHHPVGEIVVDETGNFEIEPYKSSDESSKIKKYFTDGKFENWLTDFITTTAKRVRSFPSTKIVVSVDDVYIKPHKNEITDYTEVFYKTSSSRASKTGKMDLGISTAPNKRMPKQSEILRILKHDVESGKKDIDDFDPYVIAWSYIKIIVHVTFE